MNKIFLKNSEGKKHSEIKSMIYDKLLIGNIKIQDDLGNTYDIFKNKYENEFLHVESFLIKPNGEKTYLKEVMLSNEKLPCVNYLNFAIDTHKMLCNKKGYFGAIECLPCRKCLEINYHLLEKYLNPHFIGFTPDIAFGYDGEHKIWLEINSTHECSDYKINYCFNNNITLLEIDVNNINLEKDLDTLCFKNLTRNNVLIFDKDSLINQLLYNINSIGYIKKKEFTDKYKYASVIRGNIATEDDINELLNELNLIILKTNINIAKSLFKWNFTGVSQIIISKDNYNILNEYIYKKNFNDQIDIIDKNFTIIISNIESMGYSDYNPYVTNINNALQKLNKSNNTLKFINNSGYRY